MKLFIRPNINNTIEDVRHAAEGNALSRYTAIQDKCAWDPFLFAKNERLFAGRPKASPSQAVDCHTKKDFNNEIKKILRRTTTGGAAGQVVEK